MDKMRREEESLRARYERRGIPAARARYSPFEASYLLSVQQRDRALLKELRAVGAADLSGLRILDVGCGYGHDLVRLLLWGAKAENLFGIDLLAERCDAARLLHPVIRVTQGTVAAMPFSDGTFDLVLQFTVFSSILDAAVRDQAAAEITRVLAPGGHLIWYDFWVNPTNSGTVGISPKEVRKLFPSYRGRLRRLTLAPPITRMLARKAPLLVQLLERFWPLQTHYLGVLQRPGSR